MSTASDIAETVVTVGRVIDMLGVVAKAFGIGEEQVIKVAAGAMPELAETPPDAGEAYDKVVDDIERP